MAVPSHGEGWIRCPVCSKPTWSASPEHSVLGRVSLNLVHNFGARQVLVLIAVGVFLLVGLAAYGKLGRVLAFIVGGGG